MKKLLLFLLLIIFLPNVSADNSIKLLAVNELTNNGTIVDLNLRTIDGSGKVFIETYPLSQIDTQISLRIAKTIACKTSEKYCLNKDFIYSLKTDSSVIAGPSAGAAITVLTMASLENKQLDPYTVITGVINSGGVIGTVGGVKEKIKAAANAGMKRVLIPKGESNSTELITFGESLNLEVIEVSEIEEAYGIFTNQNINYPELRVDDNYKEIMKSINEEICRRTNKLKDESEKYNLTGNATILKETGLNLSIEAGKLYDKGLYYSSASRCFGADVLLRDYLFRAENMTKDEFNEVIIETNDQLDHLEVYLNTTKITNLEGLEAVMIIRERIADARKNLNDIKDEKDYRDLSYAVERTYSSSAWEKFIVFSGKQIDESKLMESCLLKIEEVQELYNYVELYSPQLLGEVKQELDSAQENIKTGDYVLCLFKASKSEAEINSALSTLYVGDNIDSLLQKKILAAKRAIVKQENRGTFPILGYSYYEYANVLNETEPYSALLYAEYGIELSNLDIYFPQERPIEVQINQKALITLILGIVIGIAYISIRKHYRRNKIVLRRKR